jgi:amino acid transporter
MPLHLVQPKTASQKAFGLWSAVFLGIGSMVGAGIFIVIGEAGAIAGKWVVATFLLGGIIALLCGYSLAKLAIRYPSRGGIIEYLVQLYGEGVFSGALGILFYLSQLIALAAVAKSFGTYASTYTAGGITDLTTNLFATAIVALFVVINLLGANLVARSENLIVLVKLGALTIFTVAALFFIQPDHLQFERHLPFINVFYALGLVFFAYQGFSVITNSVEDMTQPEKTMLKSMTLAIVIVALLYVSVTIAVFGNLTLPEIIKAQDFALAEAAKPAFGEWGFKIMAATALIATASAINATLYATTQISYTLVKEGNLPNFYQFNVFHNAEGLLLSALIIMPLIWGFHLGQIASLAAITVLLIQGFTHLGHLFKLDETHANRWLILATVFGTFGAAWFALDYTSQKMPHLGYWLAGALLVAMLFEILLRLLTHRTISPQIDAAIAEMENLYRRWESELNSLWQMRKQQSQSLLDQRLQNKSSTTPNPPPQP